MDKPRIAVFSGPTATIQNTLPLVTSNKAREKYGLPPGHDAAWGAPYDAVRPQRLAAPVTVYIEQFSAHPLERDAAELYAAPDGYLDESGHFHSARQSPSDRAVYEVELRPEDGLYLLPYMARQANGSAWEADGAFPGAPAELSRQPFYPDAARAFEEIDRFELDGSGHAGRLSRLAAFDFYRAAPSAGYRHGRAEAERTDVGSGDIEPEVLGVDYFPYRPRHLRSEPPRGKLAEITNIVQDAMSTGRYSGAIWLEGSPYVEETAYWLNLLIDTDRPIVCCAGDIGYLGHRNIWRAVEYITSEVWSAGTGADVLGVVGLQDDQAITARELMKLDARPGGYGATGGHGGVVVSFGNPGPPRLTFRPVRRVTRSSTVRRTVLPRTVPSVMGSGDSVARTDVTVTDESGRLLSSAIPRVAIVKHARYLQGSSDRDPNEAVEVLARLREESTHPYLSGFVAEGASPYADMSAPVEAALRLATFSGIPVVKVGRGNPEGAVPPDMAELAIAGGNLTATKARLLLMACLLRFGCLPPAQDPHAPTPAEIDAVKQQLTAYQAVFDSH